jgi:hypothetical protein
MSGAHLELVLETLPRGDRNRLEGLLRGQGFDPMPMKVGFLLAAEVEELHKLLPGITGAETGDLPIPELLKDSVRSIRVVRPRSLHD